MARLSWIVIPGHPRHVTQRGNRRNRVVFDEGGYALYLDLQKVRGLASWHATILADYREAGGLDLCR